VHRVVLRRWEARSALYNLREMSAASNVRRGPWTREEIVREEIAREARAERDRTKTHQDRLEETLRLSRFMSELSHGVRSDVPAG
jgi:hypothetical protein